ncbi:VOC family protein [Nonomuraea sp. NPDC050310]|uniref:VOC family protein n=1 Tax=unclassified Nonomuraea TaxID=2593643 RepID=UPI003401E91E
MTTKAKLIATTIDCPNPGELAEFYHQITGLPIQVTHEDYAAVGDETATIYFARLDEHQAPAWPGPDKQFHLDFRVPDVDKAVKEYEALGATRPDFQPGLEIEGGGWVVMRDPAGHLFCVCPERSA